MVPLQILSFVILVSLWSFSEAVDDEIEIGELTLLRGSHHHDYKDYKKESFDCPAIYGRYPHEKDCSMFYECRYGYAHLMKCGRGKLYDEKKEQCNDKRRVNCDRSGKDNEDRGHDRDHDQKELEKDDHSKTFECPYIWGTFAHPTDCSKYFVCVYKAPRLFQCHGSDLYDERSRKCQDKRRVNCGKRLDKDQMKTSKRPDVHTSIRPRDRTTTYRPRDKTTTYWPRDKTTTYRPRDKTTTISPRYKSTTMRPRDRTTTIRPRDKTTTTEVPSTEEDNQRFRCPFPTGLFADPHDCSQFYECRSAIPTLHKCPKSNLYDERKEECVKDKYVKCGDRPGGVNEDNDKNKDKKKELRCPYLWGIFPHPEDCSKYLICIYNVPTVFNCDKDELFHAKHRRCFPKDQVTCDYRINPDDLRPYTRTPRPTTTYRPTRTPITTSITTTGTTLVPTTQPTTAVPTTQPTTAVPTTQPTTVVPTTEPTTPSTEPTTLSTEPTTLTTEPTTLSTEPTTLTTEPTTLSTEPTTLSTEPTTPSTEPTVPITESTTPATQPTTAVPTTQPTTTVPTTQPTTSQPTTKAPKPNTPPPTECEEDDLDCIIDGTGDVRGWFDCPERYGHFPHGSSHQLFIHCDNWYPYVKICADGTVFSPKYLVCMWLEQPGH